MEKVLLHVCCGVCALHPIEKLKEDFEVTALFFNPNIHPWQEYIKRKKVIERVVELSKVSLVENKYNPSIWFNVCGKYSNHREGGQRCLLCYELRLRKTFEICQEKQFNYFTTTLTISPHKDSSAIFKIGKDIGKEKFLAIDFKKREGFKKTIAAAKLHNFYRQNYCGCLYSKAKNEKQKA